MGGKLLEGDIQKAAPIENTCQQASIAAPGTGDFKFEIASIHAYLWATRGIANDTSEYYSIITRRD